MSSTFKPFNTFASMLRATDEVTNTVDNTVRSSDSFVLSSTDKSSMHNIHTVMKAPFRRVFGKVSITYTEPIVQVDTSINSSGEAYNSRLEQILEDATPSGRNFFTLYENDLSGEYHPIGRNDHVGWTSNIASDENGYFNQHPVINIQFEARPLSTFIIYFDDMNGCLIEDAIVTMTMLDGTTLVKNIVGNTSIELVIVSESDALLNNVTSVTIEVVKVSKGLYPATIFSSPTQTTFLYVGYQDRSDLISIDLLEELTYEDDIEALGGVSANEVTVVLDNSGKTFNASNLNSPISSRLLRNRKIVPQLGAEVVPGEIEWHPLGTFWSYSWDVPFNSLTASVVGFDTIGLLAQSPFKNHQVQRNKSLGYLIEYVLQDAKAALPFLEWKISSELYYIIIPYAWFENSNHAAALQRISKAYPMHIYCDRNGKICAAPQKLRLDNAFDVWSDSTNVVDKTYSSLNTALPNSIFTTVIKPMEVENDELVSDTLSFDVGSVHIYTLNFSKPYIRNLTITMDKDDTVEYTYEVYSWGIEFIFTGSGTVRSVKCTGTSLDTSNTSVISRIDSDAVKLNGTVKREVASDFIQSVSLAMNITDRLLSLTTNDKYDVEVNYRGDIALSINDPIRLLDGIAPDDRYNIKRHQLTWDGALTGIAHLNT